MHRSRDTVQCAVNFVAFIMGKRYFLPIGLTWLNLRRSAVKVTK